MSKIAMNCGYCGKKCDMKKDLCVPQDSVYVCKACYDWSQKIADLEAKLAEMTEKYNACQEARKLESEFSQQDKKELIQQLAEKDEQIKRRVAVYEQQFIEQTNENAQLKQQLAEKEEILDWQNETIEGVKQEEELLAQKLKSLGVDCIEDLGKHHNQDKIELLEKVRSNCGFFPAITQEDLDIFKKKQREHFNKRMMEFYHHNVEYIDTLIKELKGE